MARKSKAPARTHSFRSFTHYLLLNTEPSTLVGTVQLDEIHPEKDSTPIVVAEQVLEESPRRMEGNLNSFWENFDISKLRNAAHKLEYIQSQIHNEVKFAKIVLEDVEYEIKYWESAVHNDDENDKEERVLVHQDRDQNNGVDLDNEAYFTK
ncbi:hypothetical protein Cgig2_017175 [Carnegiea gigantea]|uniref:Uncharacterized protein n=1 Tax=Carnegiea gigantea TaxID=171969 RepID=A0A9Q1KB22_9CARY|nr:hypothetical protein Cgig2_017175 [Carnegiea gigantea]